MKIAGLLAVAAVTAPLAAEANWFGTEFSADTYLAAPQQPARTGKIFVGKNGMRSELQNEGQTAVQIMVPSKQTLWLVFPAQKTYMEEKLPPGAAPSGTPDPDPCTGLQGVQCKNLGEENLNGRKAVKWEMSGDRGKQLVWLDSEHHTRVRVERDGKVVFEIRYLGAETINGRAAEKWQGGVSDPQGQNAANGTFWYDPRLNTEVKVEAPGGLVRELRNIKEGPQPNSLFTVPEGYRKVEPPPAQPGPQGTPPRQ